MDLNSGRTLSNVRMSDLPTETVTLLRTTCNLCGLRYRLMLCFSSLLAVPPSSPLRRLVLGGRRRDNVFLHLSLWSCERPPSRTPCLIVDSREYWRSNVLIAFAVPKCVWQLSMYGNELKWGVSAGPGGAEESEVCEYQLKVWSCCGCFHVV